MFVSNRPEDANNPDSRCSCPPFAPPKLWTVYGTTHGLRKKYLSNILSKARKQYSMQKNGISTLLDAGMAQTLFTQHSGMSSVDSLKSYKTANKKQMMQMSHTLNQVTSRAENNRVPENEPAENRSLVTLTEEEESEADRAILAVPQRALLPQLYGAVFNNCSITINF